MYLILILSILLNVELTFQLARKIYISGLICVIMKEPRAFFTLLLADIWILVFITLPELLKLFL